MIVQLQYNHVSEYSGVALPPSKAMAKPNELTKLPKRQLSIKESFGKLVPLSRSSTRRKSLANAVC